MDLVTFVRRQVLVFSFHMQHPIRFCVLHFSLESARQKPIITCRLTLILNENTPSERRESFVVPLRKVGDLTHIKTLMF
jgi:hypothetical protein